MQNTQAGTQKNIAFILSNNTPLYQYISDNINKRLSSNYFKKTFFLATQVSTNLHKIKQADLIVTIGSRAAKKILNTNVRTNILATLISNVNYNDLKIRSNLTQKFHVIILDQHIKKQLRYIHKLFPNKKRLGAIIGPRWKNKLSQIKDIAMTEGFSSIDIKYINNSSKVISTLVNLLEKVDIFIVFNDPDIIDRQVSKKLIYLAFKNKIPVIGYSPAFVNGGAAAAIYTTKSQIASQTVNTILRWQKTGFLPKKQFPSHLKIEVNRTVIRNFGLKIANHVVGQQ